MQERATHRQYLAVGVHGNFRVPQLIPLLCCRHEMLATVLDPFDGLSQHECGHCHDRFFRVEHKLGAKAAADVGRGHAHRRLVATQ